MLYQQKKRAMKHQVITQAGGNKATKESILDVLFPYEESGDFYVYWWDNPWEQDRKWWQRLNMIWVVPVYYITIAPFQWILKGRVGVDEKSKFGELIIKLTGVR